MITIYNGHSECCSCFLEKPVGVSIQSPPYKDADGYSELTIKETARSLYEIHRNNTVCFVVFGDLSGQSERPFEVAELFRQSCWNLLQTIFWVKAIDGDGQFTPINSARRLNNCGEYIFMFSKGDKVKLNRLAIGIPYSDKSNLVRFGHKKDLRCRGNVWYIPYKTHQSASEKLHKDRFPEELVRRCLLLSGITRRSLVLDAFVGGGTTCLVAEQMGFNSIGVEKSAAIFGRTVKTLRDRFGDDAVHTELRSVYDAACSGCEVRLSVENRQRS